LTKPLAIISEKVNQHILRILSSNTLHRVTKRTTKYSIKSIVWGILSSRKHCDLCSGPKKFGKISMPILEEENSSNLLL